MKVVVTGGAGFIGSAFINYLKSNYSCDILCIDNMTYCSNINNIKHNVKFLKKDIREVTSSELGDYDYLVNFAAESHVDNSITNGLPFIRTNVEGTFNLLELAKKNKKLKKFIQISTDEVYGDMNDSDIENRESNEEDCLVGSSYYSSSKASADLLVLSSNRTYGLPYLITRTCNNFGEHQFPEKFLPLIYKRINEEKEIPVYGDGMQEREWIYVYDNVKIITDLMLDNTVINTIYNIGSGVRFKNIEIVKYISELLNKEVNFKFVADRLGHDRAYRLNSNKLISFYKKTNLELPKFKHLKDYLKEMYN